MKLSAHRLINSRRRNHRGFTLTELAIVLGIVGLILGAIWVAAAAVYNNLRVAHANTELLQIAQGIRDLYVGMPNAGNVASNVTDSLVCAKDVPSDIVQGQCGSSTLIGAWTSSTTAVYVPADGNSFTIEMSNVPQSSCISLLMAAAGTAKDPSLFAAVANATPQAAAFPTPATPDFNIIASPGLANTNADPMFGGCNSSGPGGNVSVAFAFGLK